MKTCVLIQTCDKYENLWEGLHLSYHFNWCWDLEFPIYVLTEEKDFITDERFQTLKFGYLGDPPYNFSTRLIAALEHLKSLGYDSIFYTQDDFWPLFKVDSNIFRKTYDLFNSDGIECIHINEYLPWYSYNLGRTGDSISGKEIRKFNPGSMYYYNHQSAFWKIDSLLRIQNPGERPDHNEDRGTERSWEINPNYYFLSYDWYKAEFIAYKGELLNPALTCIRDWKFRLEWESN
jgi:hypothetical protein